jgi:hypothetical protein
VESGLSRGDVIITHGQEFLADGTRVRPRREERQQ